MLVLNGVRYREVPLYTYAKIYYVRVPYRSVWGGGALYMYMYAHRTTSRTVNLHAV